MGVKRTPAASRQGWKGWDEYARFYDWENVRTFGRRDVAFWRQLGLRQSGAVLELGCGTGRLLVPIAKAGVRIVGVDRSAAMLAAARRRAGTLPRRVRPAIVRGDVRQLPFASRTFALVLAPYGLLQSMLGDRDLDSVLRDAARVLHPGGLIGIDLVPELPTWAEYGPRVRLKGRAPGGGTVTLVESVRQDRKRGLTTFDEEFVETRAGRRARRRRFSLTFRTRPMTSMRRRIERAGFRIEAVLGDYRGRPWDARAETWLIIGRKQ